MTNAKTDTAAVHCEGPLLKVAIADLRPTQLTVGMIEVANKTAEISKDSKERRQEYLSAHPVPVVRGPGGALYLIDHHHLVRALLDAGFHHAECSIVADLSTDTAEQFWAAMETRQWVYLHDANGKARAVSALPKTVAGLIDDPYRSLAGAVRKAGGYAKTGIPFAEFKWADFFRTRIKIESGKKGFEAALEQALPLAHHAEAAQLPGYLKKAATG